MKRMLALFLAVLLCCSFVACKESETDKPGNETTAPNSATQGSQDGDETTPTLNPDLCDRESYTADDETVKAAMDTVVATAGDAKLTNGMLQIYYWLDYYTFLNNYGNYISYMGLDPTAPLDEQGCPSYEDATWQHNFLSSALNAWQNYQALALMADVENIPIEKVFQEDLDKLEETLKASAEKGKHESVDAMLQAEAGPGCNFQVYKQYMEIYYKGYSYFNAKASEINITDDMVGAYFDEHAAELKEQGIEKDGSLVHDVRHILIPVEGGTKDKDGNTTYSDAEWAACQAKAQKILDEWLAGDATEDTFAEFANKHSTDPGSNTKGGMYSDLTKETNFVEEFKNWYLDSSRKAGDYGLVKSSYGYHIMYYSGYAQKWFRESKYYMMDEMSAKIVTDAVEKYPMTVNYDAIVLGFVDVAKESE